MKTILSLVLILLFITTVFVPNTSAQDYTRLNLPEGAKARLSKGRINEIAYAPDGALLAVASSIGIWLYDAETGEELDFPTGPTYLIGTIAFSSDGNTLASGSDDDTIRLRVEFISTHSPLAISLLHGKC